MQKLWKSFRFGKPNSRHAYRSISTTTLRLIFHMYCCFSKVPFLYLAGYWIAEHAPSYAVCNITRILSTPTDLGCQNATSNPSPQRNPDICMPEKCAFNLPLPFPRPWSYMRPDISSAGSTSRLSRSPLPCSSSFVLQCANTPLTKTTIQSARRAKDLLVRLQQQWEIRTRPSSRLSGNSNSGNIYASQEHSHTNRFDDALLGIDRGRFDGTRHSSHNDLELNGDLG